MPDPAEHGDAVGAKELVALPQPVLATRVLGPHRCCLRSKTRTSRCRREAEPATDAMVRAPRDIADSDETLAEMRERVGPFSKGRYIPDPIGRAELLLRASRFTPYVGPVPGPRPPRDQRLEGSPGVLVRSLGSLPPADLSVLHCSVHTGWFEAALHSLVVSA